MAVSYRTGINILQIIFFFPSLLLAIYLCVHDGLKNAGTWRYIATLSALRVAGDIAYFVSLSHPTVSALVAVVVCEMIGLAPLTLTCIAFIARVNKISQCLPQRAFILVSIMCIVGLVIGIVGANNELEAASSFDDVQINGLSKAALALFLVAFGLMMLAFLRLAVDAARHTSKRRALGTEIRILYAVGLACPFVLVRLIYAALADYQGDRKYSAIDGNNTIYLCMGVLMEIFAITICLGSAILIPVPPRDMRKVGN